MPTFLRCALWQIPTMVAQPYDIDELDATNAFHRVCASIEQRYAMLSDVVRDASRTMQSIPVPPGAKALDLFVAPEYLFTTSGTTHFFDEAQKDLIVSKLHQLSAAYMNTIIIPGTVCWRKPATRGTNSSFFRSILACCSKTFDDRPDRLDRAESRIREAGRLDLVNTRDKLGALAAAKQRKLESGHEIFLGYNTAFVMHQGDVVLKYHKRNDGGEVTAADSRESNVVWIPGAEDSLFTIDGVSFGLEICAEKGNLQNLGHVVDVLILIAASRTAHTAQRSVREGGYILHADAMEEPSALHRARGERYFDGAGNVLAGKSFARQNPAQRAVASPLGAAGVDEQLNRFLATRATPPKPEVLQRTRTRLGGNLHFFGLPLG